MTNTKSKKISYIYEKFKTFLLIFLMTLCIIQIGILWSSESDRFPISLLSNSKSISPTSIEDSKGKYLSPYRVVISTGFDGDHYLIPNGTKEYETLWAGAKQYITQALELKPKQTEIFSEDRWGTLAANKPYTFEFKTQIPLEIVKWTLNLKSSAGEGISGIYKVVICPDDSDNNYSDTLYLRDDKNIYTYELKDFKGNALNKDEFNSIYTKQQSSDNAKNYQLAIEKYRKYEIALDLPGIFSNKGQESYPDITCRPITGLEQEQYSINDFNTMALELFGNARNDYDFDIDVNGSVVFKKADGVYRLYKNSILEYKYSGNQESTEELSVLKAYKKAIAFLLEHSNQNDIMDKCSVYLNSIEKGQNSIEKGQSSFVFNFDYSISLGEGAGELPILLKDYEIPNSHKPVDHGISIEASSKKVIRFEWLVLKLNINKGIESYQWNFGDMYEKMRNNNAKLKSEEFSAKDFGIYYVLNYPKNHENPITPSFVLFTKDGRYDISMEGNNK